MEGESPEDFDPVMTFHGHSFELVVGVAQTYWRSYLMEVQGMCGHVGDPNH